MLWTAGGPGVGSPGAYHLGTSSSQPLTTCSVHPIRAVPGVGAPVSGIALVLVHKPTEHIDTLDRPRAERNLVGHRGNDETDTTVGPCAVVVANLGRQHPLEVSTVPGQDPVQALGPNASHPSLRIGVRPEELGPGSSQTRTPSAANTASKLATNLASRSRTIT